MATGVTVYLDNSSNGVLQRLGEADVICESHTGLVATRSSSMELPLVFMVRHFTAHTCLFGTFGLICIGSA